MSIIRTVDEDDATGLVAEIYAEDRESMGYVPPHTRAMAMNPEAVLAWDALAKAIAGPMDKRRYELVTLAAAEAIGSQACLLAHSLRSLRYMPEETVLAVARDYRDAGLTPAEVAMMEYAAKLSGDSASMTDADSQVLRDHGFTDRDIVDITLAAAMRNYYSRSLHALAVEVDVPPALSVELRDAVLAKS